MMPRRRAGQGGARRDLQGHLSQVPLREQLRDARSPPAWPPQPSEGWVQYRLATKKNSSPNISQKSCFFSLILPVGGSPAPPLAEPRRVCTPGQRRALFPGRRGGAEFEHRGGLSEAEQSQNDRLWEVGTRVQLSPGVCSPWRAAADNSSWGCHRPDHFGFRFG